MNQRIFKGTIEYTAECRGVRFAEPVDFSVSHPSVEKVSLESTGTDTISVKFFVIDEQSVESASAIASHFIDKILNKIGFSFDAYVGIPRFTGGNIVEELISEDGSKSVTIHSSALTTSTHATGTFELVPPTIRIKELLQGLNFDHDLVAHYLNEYRFAVLNTDPIAVFMTLYNILLQILGDNQNSVDDFIRLHDPSIEEFPDRQGKQTLYSKLRNDVGHPKKRPLKETSEEIYQILNHFKILVRKAIEEET